MKHTDTDEVWTESDMREIFKNDPDADYHMVQDEAWRIGDRKLAIKIERYLEVKKKLDRDIKKWVHKYQEGLEQQKVKAE